MSCFDRLPFLHPIHARQVRRLWRGCMPAKSYPGNDAGLCPSASYHSVTPYCWSMMVVISFGHAEKKCNLHSAAPVLIGLQLGMPPMPLTQAGFNMACGGTNEKEGCSGSSRAAPAHTRTATGARDGLPATIECSQRTTTLVIHKSWPPACTRRAARLVYISTF